MAQDRNPFGRPMPPVASPRNYGTNDAYKPCSDDKVSYPDAWKPLVEIERESPSEDAREGGKSGRY